MFSDLGTLKIVKYFDFRMQIKEIDACSDRARQELMRTLTIRISSLRACSACASVSHFSNVHFVYPQHIEI